MFIGKPDENGTLNVILRSLMNKPAAGYDEPRLRADTNCREADNLLIRIISAPGLWLQRITTKEPDDDMLECAIVALKNVIPGDRSDDWK